MDAGTYDNNVHYSATKKVRPSLPPPGASAQEVASWWSSLSDDDKQWMIEQHPDVIGNLEGVDYTSRNQVNRIMLPRLKKQAEADLQKFYDDNGPYIEPALRSERDRLKNRVTALEQIEETLNRENTENPPVPRYLMQLDASGPNILAAVSQNNPDDADHIGVIVPGMTTSVAGSLGDYDNHAKVMREAAEEAAGPGQKVAMVEFFGYGAPPGLIEASSTTLANEGAPKLAGFLNGIDAAREHGAGDAHITVAGHSYGSTTAGIAATPVNDGVIDDIVQFGSPGSGVQDVREFHVPEGHTYVSAACAPFFGGSMNPFSSHVKSVEAFQRDLEPAIIAARNELVTAENFMAYKNGYSIDHYTRGNNTLYAFHSRMFFFAELDTDLIRDTYNKHLLPLGFELSEKRWTSNGVEIVNFLWINDEYQAVVSATTRLGEESATRYYTMGNPTDGSTSDPTQLLDQPGRIPDWFDPSLPPAGQG